MKLTKDEARLLAVALEIACYDLYDKRVPGLNPAMNNLHARLVKAGEDKRRNGRTTQNDWSDLELRLGQKFLKEGGQAK